MEGKDDSEFTRAPKGSTGFVGTRATGVVKATAISIDGGVAKPKIGGKKEGEGLRASVTIVGSKSVHDFQLPSVCGFAFAL
jgi:hypothetical protein